MHRAFSLLVGMLLAPQAYAIPEISIDPNVGADNCSTTVNLSCVQGGTIDFGTTAGAENTVTQLVGGCQGLTSVPGPDVIYRLSNEIGFSSALAVRVVPAPGYDVAIYLLRSTDPGCPAGSSNSVANCVAAANAGGPGVAEVIPFESIFSLPTGKYFLFIDSPNASGSASAGTYTVQLLSICPVELFDYSVE